MKTSRAFLFAGGSAMILGIGYQASPKELPSLDFVDPVGESTPAATDDAAGAGGGAPEAEPEVTLVDGPAVYTQRGPVQVQLAIQEGTITAINGLALGSPHPNTIRIVSGALPELRERVLEGQTWDIEYASGASFFSPGFSESVRGAMETAGLVSGTQPVQQPGEAPDQSADYDLPGPDDSEFVIQPWADESARG